MIDKTKPLAMSPEEIQAWQEKDKYRRKVKKLSYENEEGKTDDFYVVPGNRTTMGAVSDMMKKGTGMLKINEVIINACVQAGNMERLEWDDALYLGLLDDIGSMNEQKKSSSTG
jgi:hypothetical protein